MIGKVIAISGIAGSGKSSLVKKLAEHYSATSIHFDDYAPLLRDETVDFDSWLDNIDLNVWKTEEMVQDIQQLKSDKVVKHLVFRIKLQPTDFIFLEEPTGRSRDVMKELVDTHIHISVPLEIGLQRWITARLELKIDDSKKLKMINDYISNYHLYRNIYLYTNSFDKTADFTISGLKSQQDILSTIISFIDNKTL